MAAKALVLLENLEAASLSHFRPFSPGKYRSSLVRCNIFR
jgi:hypothetical protein